MTVAGEHAGGYDDHHDVSPSRKLSFWISFRLISSIYVVVTSPVLLIPSEYSDALLSFLPSLFLCLDLPSCRRYKKVSLIIIRERAQRCCSFLEHPLSLSISQFYCLSFLFSSSTCSKFMCSLGLSLSILCMAKLFLSFLSLSPDSFHSARGDYSVSHRRMGEAEKFRGRRERDERCRRRQASIFDRLFVYEAYIGNR